MTGNSDHSQKLPQHYSGDSCGESGINSFATDSRTGDYQDPQPRIERPGEEGQREDRGTDGYRGIE